MLWIYILVMVWIHSGFVNFMLVIFRLCTGYVQVIFWICSCSGYILLMVWIYSGLILLDLCLLYSGFWSGYVKLMLKLGSRYVQTIFWINLGYGLVMF